MPQTDVAEALRLLGEYWERSGRDWHDEMRARCEREYLTPLQAETRAYLASWEQAAKMAEVAQRFATTVKSIHV